MRATITAEELIAPFQDPNNGGGPLWCYGSRTIARVGDTVYIVARETSPDVQPLCNTRWVLYRRKDGGALERIQANPTFDEREPCMMAKLPDGRLIISVNPAQELRAPWPDGRRGAKCEPRLLYLDSAAPEKAPTTMLPEWGQTYSFSEHSYRALAADPTGGSFFMTNQVPVGWEHLHAFIYYDSEGHAQRQGLLHFPMRGCYQQIAVRGKAVYVMAISDETEPNDEWRAYKREKTGNEWDYDFRQLFYTWTPDITTTDFSPILTVASRDETAGYMLNLDMWLDPNGDAHLLYIERNIWHPFMRNKFFPGTPITVALKQARIHKGRVADRRTLFESVETPESVAAHLKGEGKGIAMDGPMPEYGAFQATPDGRLFVFWYQNGKDAGNYLRQVWPEMGEPIPVPLQKPLTRFFNASERNGNQPSNIIDLYGTPAKDQELRYVQIRLAE